MSLSGRKIKFLNWKRKSRREGESHQEEDPSRSGSTGACPPAGGRRHCYLVRAITLRESCGEGCVGIPAIYIFFSACSLNPRAQKKSLSFNECDTEQRRESYQRHWKTFNPVNEVLVAKTRSGRDWTFPGQNFQSSAVLSTTKVQNIGDGPKWKT